MFRTRGRHVRRSRFPVRAAVAVAALVVPATIGLSTVAQTPVGEQRNVPTATAVPIAVTTSETTEPSSTTTTLTPPTTGLDPRSFTMAFAGDFLVHGPIRSVAASHGASTGRPYDFRPIMEPIRPFVSAVDWAVCHLEVNLSADGTRLSGYPRFRAPGELAADAVDIGFDACTTASNHVIDHGVAGIAETLEVMDAAGLGFTGSARTPEEEWSSRLFEVEDVRVAHLSYTYWFNGLRVPASAPWTSREIDEEMILADAARARAEGAEFTVVSLHWGTEYRHQPNGQQTDLGPRLLASPDIDLIVGHHAHVVQPIDRVDGKWLIYGLGNLLAHYSTTAPRDELLVTVEVREGGTGRFQVSRLSVLPLYMDQSRMQVMPSGPAYRPGDADASLASRLDGSYERVLEVLRTGSGWGQFDIPG